MKNILFSCLDLLARYLNQSITEKECHTITSDKSHRLGPDWKKLGRELGIPEAMIQSSAQKENDVERAHAMLIDFCRDQGKNVKIKRLVESLKKIGRTDITEKLLGNLELWLYLFFFCMLRLRSQCIEEGRAGEI